MTGAKNEKKQDPAYNYFSFHLYRQSFSDQQRSAPFFIHISIQPKVYTKGKYKRKLPCYRPDTSEKR